MSSRIGTHYIGVTLMLSGACADAERSGGDAAATDSVVNPAFQSPDSNPRPPGFEPEMGWLHSGSGAASWALRLGRAPSGTFVVLDSLVGREADGKALWQTRAHLEIESLRPNEVFVPLTCRHGGVGDPDVFAVVRDDGSELLQAVHAWRVEPSTRSFVVVDPATVTCVREIP